MNQSILPRPRRLDHLATAAPATAAEEVAGLLDKLRASPTAAAALRAVDESEELAPPEESALLAAIAAVPWAAPPQSRLPPVRCEAATAAVC